MDADIGATANCGAGTPNPMPGTLLGKGCKDAVGMGCKVVVGIACWMLTAGIAPGGEPYVVGTELRNGTVGMAAAGSAPA